MLENLEKMAKELGLSKSGMISVALENYKKGQENKKEPLQWLKAKYFWVNYTVWQKKSKIFHFPTLSRFNSRRLGNEIELLGLPMAISPLHDKDLSSVEGQLTKSTLSCALCGEKSSDR